MTYSILIKLPTFSRPKIQISQPILIIFFCCLPNILITLTPMTCHIQIVIKSIFVLNILMFWQAVQITPNHQGKFTNSSRPVKHKIKFPTCSQIPNCRNPAYIHTHIHTHTYTYIHTHIHTYIHTYIHTHAYTEGMDLNQNVPLPTSTSAKPKAKRNKLRS